MIARLDNKTESSKGSFLVIARWVILIDRQRTQEIEIVKGVILIDCVGGSFSMIDKAPI